MNDFEESQLTRHNLKTHLTDSRCEKKEDIVNRAKYAVMRDMAGEICRTRRRGCHGAHLMTIWTLDLPTEEAAYVAML